jgi:uncharacterized membrane protein YhaH (DUF805 family)
MGYPANMGYPGHLLPMGPVVPGQPTTRINRATFGLILALFWGAAALLIGIGVAVVDVPKVPVQMEDGTTTNLTSTLIKTGDGCSINLADSECVDFWNERSVTLQQIQAIDRAETRRLLFALPVLPLLIPFGIAQARRHHDCGRSAGMMFINLIPCVGFIFAIINLVQEGEGYVNKYGPPPRRGINWKSLYGAKATS